MIVTSNKRFSAWGKIFGDDVVAAATIDRLVRARPGRREDHDRGRIVGVALTGAVYDAEALGEQP